MKKSKQMALCGVLAALAVVIMVLGGVIPMAAYCAPVLAALLLLPVLEGCGKRIAWAWFGAVAVLTLLLCPNLESSLLFLCLGYYPILRQSLQRIPKKLPRLLLKLLVFHLALMIMTGLLIPVMGLEQVIQDNLGEGAGLFVLTWLMGVGVFLLTDTLLGRFGRMFKRRK